MKSNNLLIEKENFTSIKDIINQYVEKELISILQNNDIETEHKFRLAWQILEKHDEYINFIQKQVKEIQS